jgi:hypothetical protein
MKRLVPHQHLFIRQCLTNRYGFGINRVQHFQQSAAQQACTACVLSFVNKTPTTVTLQNAEELTAPRQ